MDKPYDLIVFIGRFQPWHQGHQGVLEKALHLAKACLIIIGSASIVPNYKNPFSWQQRKHLLLQGVGVLRHRVYINTIKDYGDDELWYAQIKKLVYQTIPATQNIALIGHIKDDSSYYLKLFPEWGFISVENIAGIHATDIRADLYRRILYCQEASYAKKHLHPQNWQWLKHWCRSDQARMFALEWQNILHNVYILYSRLRGNNQLERPKT
jgi:bifunctional NMN adenylyltransferase/nudix hydrolase